MKNLSIQAKLAVGFGVLIVLLLTISIYAGYSAMRLNKEATDIAEHWMANIETYADIDGAASDSRRKLILMNLRPTAEQMAKDEAAIQGNHKIVEAAIDKYRTEVAGRTYASEDERQKDNGNIQEIAVMWQSYAIEENKVIAMVKAGTKGEAVAAINGTSSKQYNALNDLLTQVTDDSRQGAELAKQDSGNIYRSVLLTAGILGIIAVLLGFVTASIIISHIKSSVKEILRVFELSAKGDFRSTVQIGSQDEFGDIAVHYNAVIHEIGKLIRRIQDMSQQLAAASEQLTASAEQSAEVTQQIARSITDVSESAAAQQEAVSSTNAMTKQASDEVRQAVDSAQCSRQRTQQGV